MRGEETPFYIQEGILYSICPKAFQVTHSATESSLAEEAKLHAPRGLM